MHRILFLVALLCAAAVAQPIPPTPPTGTYCQPVALRDFAVVIGYQAVVQAAPGCKKPALIRKESRINHFSEPPILVPVGRLQRIWLLTHRLSYTMDGQTWRPLAVR
ncbi:hypothetical protein GO986_08525 [Deinococcus sp. HMF7620]|uniref:Uncharacterized protein n=1 Tax=Deinococcus arboris TaxID=2682977 RepID=A0A7C9IAI3_9DEIO|nr:hypothetical protein [Deinococcus arboris]MVN86806.1 hypothetical protein [Deinococcus arboris]